MTLAVSEFAPLHELNTLAIDVSARYFLTISELEHIPQAVLFAQQKRLPLMVLGAGSNVVFSADFPGVVAHMALRGIEVEINSNHEFESAQPANVVVNAAAGENWHQLVQQCLQRGFYGLENLALIPGTAGAAPIQNIGAYGIELNQLLQSVTGWDLTQQKWRVISATECEFGYRDSIFKQALKDKFIISSIALGLSTRPNPICHYSALADQLAMQGIDQPTPQQIAAAVMDVRRSKLPDPAQIPNAGSFFKNPVIGKQQFDQLALRYPGLVSYPQPSGNYKLAAGWLVEQAGWKGVNRKSNDLGQVGVHHRQALVLVNHGSASGADILSLAAAIQRDVSEKFGVELDIEPRVY